MSKYTKDDVLGPDGSVTGDKTDLRCPDCGLSDATADDDNRYLRVHQKLGNTTILECPNCHHIERVPTSSLNTKKKK